MSASPDTSFLFPIAEVSGYAALAPRERKFAVGLLSGLKPTEAARLAGVAGDKQRQAEAGSKLARNGKVLAFLNQAWVKSGNTPEEFIARVAERARLAHEACRSLEQGSAKWARAFLAANKEDALLAAIHGRLNIKLSGDLTIRHVTVEQKSGFFAHLQSSLAGARN